MRRANRPMGKSQIVRELGGFGFSVGDRPANRSRRDRSGWVLPGSEAVHVSVDPRHEHIAPKALACGSSTTTPVKISASCGPPKCQSARPGPISCRPGGSSGRRERLEDDDRCFSQASCGPVVQVLVDLAPALPQPFTLVALTSTSRLTPPASSTTASGWACRLSHQAGSGAPQPFMAIETRLCPSS
jgi:hypothetical protein